MVSKLLLATQESCLRAIQSNADNGLIGKMLEHYYEIYEGIGVHKSPELYGAFSTDPYSHTPMGKGAQQPGMTGQVKEDILSRFGELGVFVEDGCLYFDPCLLRKTEFLQVEKKYRYIDVTQESKELFVSTGTLCFSYCQVPITYSLHEKNNIIIKYKNQSELSVEGLRLDHKTSKEIFSRKGNIERITVQIRSDILK
jgi:hypothetical protein